MLAANVSFATINMNRCELEIRLGYLNQATLNLTYGWSFWLCLCAGKSCVKARSHLSVA